jgi:hypothetical protein
MMPKKPSFDAATTFPRISDLIGKVGSERYIRHWGLVEKLMTEPIVRARASDENTPLGIATKMVGVFSSYFSKDYTKYNMNQYRREFSRKRVGGV